MSDPRAALAELADAIGRGRSDGSFDSERAVQLRAVEPLLEILDWDVRGTAVVPEAQVNDQTVDYLLQIEGTPAVVVQTVSPETDPTDDELLRLESALSNGPITRGIVTDGRTLILLIADAEEVHRRPIPFESLAEHANDLGQFHRSVVEESVTSTEADRRDAARRLVANRDELVDDVTAEILAIAGPAFEDAVREESTRTVDTVIDRLEPDAVEVVDAAERATEGTGKGTASEIATDAGGNRDPETGEANEPSKGEGSQGESTSVTGGSTIESAEATAGGEYVVRFFGGASSVGAVGTQSPGGTLVGTVRYLLENHDLEASLALPWQTGDGTTVLAKDGKSPEWTTLENASGDAVAVRAVDEPSLAKEAIQDLADAAGLRVMYQGDW